MHIAVAATCLVAVDYTTPACRSAALCAASSPSSASTSSVCSPKADGARRSTGGVSSFTVDAGVCIEAHDRAALGPGGATGTRL
ncbi:MAG TPA: hypothetical protein VIK56_12555 [Rhodoferax sp.]